MAPQRLLLAAVLAALLADCRADGGGKRQACTLASLSLHFGDRPIDLEPAFRPSIFGYQATLDFSMSSFSISARPDTGCEVDAVPEHPVEARIGGSQSVTLHARRPLTGASEAYTITVNRLLGSETDLQFLMVQGGELSPTFDPMVRSYDVLLPLSLDTARIIYRLRDNEQRIRGSAQLQHPTGEEGNADEGAKEEDGEDPKDSKEDANEHKESSEADGGKNDEDEAGEKAKEGGKEDEEGGKEGEQGEEEKGEQEDKGRRLRAFDKIPPQRAGEVQYRFAYMSFMLDVGFTRVVELTIQCADATQASIGTYTLKITRPGCVLSAPFFSPMGRRCVNFCPSGYYRNRAVQRCSRCNANCQACSGLLDCNMCVPDTVEYTYVLESNGSCRAVENHLFKKYLWWCIGLGILLAVMVIAGIVALCCVCCSGLQRKSERQARTYDSDSDEPLQYVAGRRLAGY